MGIESRHGDVRLQVAMLISLGGVAMSCSSPTALDAVAMRSTADGAAQPAVKECAVAAEAPAHAEPIVLEGDLAGLRDMYNRTYANPATSKLEPNAFMLDSLARIEQQRRLLPAFRNNSALPPMEALDIAMGDGRNAMALAQLGHHVTGFDISDVGVNSARRRAHELRLDHLLDVQVADAHTFDYGENQYDLVLMMYYFPWSPHGVDELINRIKRSVKPGGWLILEYTDRRSTNDALVHFLDWQIVHYERDLHERDWAPHRSKVKAFVTRLLARKPT